MMYTPPILATSAAKEPMLLYIVATNRVISTVIMVEHAEASKLQPVHRPVYYLSKVLCASK